MPTGTTDQTRAFGHWIDGAFTPSESSATFDRNSPSHGSPVSSYARGTAGDVDRAVASARHAFEHGPWPRTCGAERTELLLKTASLLGEHTEALAELEMLETGKPISQARDEIGWTIGLWQYAATLPRHLTGQTYNQLGDGTLGLVLREPIGVVGLITPWNFPLLIASQKLPFALAAGCTTVIKPSEFTSGTTLRLAELLKQAGLPDGACNVVTGYGDPVGQRLAEHDDIDMVSFTGSTRVGKSIVSASAGNLKKVALELGGKNPQVVFPDADLDAVVDAVVFGAFFNMGECCNAGSRLLAHRDIADTLTSRIVEASQTIRVGDPFEEDTQVGAIINDVQFKKIMTSLNDAKSDAARVRCGGETFALNENTPHSFIQPTVLDQIEPGSEIAKTEVFGPVLAVIAFDDVDHAVAIANESMYGLSASVWTRDLDTAMATARRIKAGTVWINTFLESTGELPFGGYRQSGQGRELGSQAAEEYTELKTIPMHLGPRAPVWVKP